MGIKDNLRRFCDPDYEDFEGFPDPEDPSDAAQKWQNAIGPELSEILSPMMTAGLNFSQISSKFISSLDTSLFRSSPGGELPDGLDKAMDDAAATVSDLVTPASSAIAPTDPLDSANLIFDPNFDDEDLSLTPEEICERAEDRITEWLMGGTFTAWWIGSGSPPAGSPGVSGTPWVLPPGMEMPEPPDSDEDGYSDAEEIDSGTDPEDPEDYPEE